MEKIKNNLDLQINGVKYTFSSQIGANRMLFDSFNQLAKETFGISFDHFGGDYQPHVLAIDGKVCANISVNQIPFYYRGERKFYIQLGTVMTSLEFRGKGLSRWLMKQILDQWKDHCDTIYLFANDSVLNFYPQFGFVKVKEYEYIRKGIDPSSTMVQKLEMEEAQSIALVTKKYRQGNPFSALFMIENKELLSFYCRGIMKENVYYSAQYDVVIIGERKDKKVWCYDIFGETDASLEDVLMEFSLGTENEIILGFTPLNAAGFTCREHVEEDTTLFILGENHCFLSGDQLMFPVISHA